MSAREGNSNRSEIRSIEGLPSRAPYVRPAVVLGLDLETRAGTPKIYGIDEFEWDPLPTPMSFLGPKLPPRGV